MSLCNINYSHQPEGLSIKENETHTLRQPDDPVYDELSSIQPNYSSLGKEVCAVNDQVTSGIIVYIELLSQPQTELTNPTAKNESVENDFYNVEQHTYEMVKANMKKYINEKGDENESNVQETSNYTTPVRDDASKKGGDF